MIEVVWIEALPRAPATALPQSVLLAGGGQDKPYRHPVDGRQFRAGVVRRPLFSARLGFDESGWNGSTRPQTSVISFSTADPDLRASLAALVWKDAPVTVSSGPEGSAPATILLGKVQDAEFTRAGMTLTIIDLSQRLERAIVNGQFAGTGGIEGPLEAKGRPKRRSWGYVFNVEGRLIDVANSVYEFGDPAHPFAAWSALRDKGREGSFTTIAWQGSIGATLTALAASAPVRGGGVVAPSIACAKWWTRPSGPLTADFIASAGTGGSMQAAAIADAISRAGGGPGVDGLAAANALRPGTVGIHVASENESFAQAIDRLLLGVSLLWIPRPNGTLAIREWAFDEDAAILKAVFKGRARTFPPHGKRSVGFQRNERRHSDSEIAGILLEEITDGDVLLARADLLNSQQQWENVLDGAGTRPADNATVGATLGADFKSPGAVVYNQAQIETALGTAAAIAGQAAWATYSLTNPDTVRLQTQRLSTSGALGADWIFDHLSPATYLASVFPGERGANRTETRTAAGIVGQGGLATKNAVAWNSELTNRPGWAVNTYNIGGSDRLRADFVYDSGATRNLDTFFPATIGSDKTGNATAAGIIGQAPAATDATIQSGATNDRIPDTRNTDQLPSWYRTNYPFRAIKEFKDGQAIGVTGTTGSYGSLETTVDWTGPSGGVVKQRFTSGVGLSAGHTFVRFGASDDASWGGWSRTFAENQKPWFGSDLLEGPAGAIATLGNFKTIQGTAAAISGQTAWATYTAPISRVSRINDDGLIPAAGVYLAGWNYLHDVFPAEFGSNKTETRTAAAISGQGALATKNVIANDVDLGGVLSQRLLPSPADSNFLNAGRMAWSEGGTVQAFKPAEAAANKTETRTAAAIAGQTAWATYNLTDPDAVRLKTQRLTSSGALGGDWIYDHTAPSVYLSDVFPGERGANKTETRTSAAIAGQGPGATATAADVLNNRFESSLINVAAPVGGFYSNNVSGVTGRINVYLPTAANSMESMISFEVQVYSYQDGQSATYKIAGYTYPSANTWYQVSANLIGADSRSVPVRFGRMEDGRFVVQIGDNGTVWHYPQIIVRNLIVGYGGLDLNIWKTGWSIAVGPGNPSGSIAGMVAKPVAGDALFGLNVREGSGGDVATLGNFKTSQGAAAAIAGQGALATLSAVTTSQMSAPQLTEWFASGTSGEGGLRLLPNFVECLSAGPNTSWERSALTRSKITGGARISARIEDVASGGPFMIGLTDVDAVAVSTSEFASGRYNLYSPGLGQAYTVYESGANVVGGPAAAVGDLIEVIYAHNTVTYAVTPANGSGRVVIRTVTTTKGRSFRGLANLVYPGYQVIGLTFRPYVEATQANKGFDLTVAGSGQRVANIRSLAPITSLNLNYKFTGAITYSASAGSPATATISVAAGNALAGSSPVAYAAMSANVTGTGGTVVTFYLYVIEGADTSTWGGSKTLQVTTVGDNVFASDNNVYIGSVNVTFPTSGSGSGSGTGGGGGPPADPNYNPP